MEQRWSSKLERFVSSRGFGSWAIGGDSVPLAYGPTNDADSYQALSEAIEMGVTVIDTADVYGGGHSEQIIGEVLRNKPYDGVIVTKVGNDFYSQPQTKNYSFAYCTQAYEFSAKRLGRGADVLLLHNPPDAEICSYTGVIEQLKENLGIPVGISFRRFCISPNDAREIAGVCDFIETTYNLLDTQPLYDMYHWAKYDTEILIKEPLCNGWLTLKHTPFSTFAATDFRKSKSMDEKIETLLEAYYQINTYLKEGETPAQTAIRMCEKFAGALCVLVGAKTPSQAKENFI